MMGWDRLLISPPRRNTVTQEPKYAQKAAFYCSLSSVIGYCCDSQRYVSALMEISASGNKHKPALNFYFTLFCWRVGVFFILTSSSFRMCRPSSTAPQQPINTVPTQCGVWFMGPPRVRLVWGVRLFAAASSGHNSSAGAAGRSEKSPLLTQDLAGAVEPVQGQVSLQWGLGGW